MSDKAQELKEANEQLEFLIEQELYHKVIELAEKLSLFFKDEKSDENFIKALNYKFIAQLRSQQITNDIELANSILNSAINILSENHSQVAISYQNLGEAFMKYAKYEEAEKYYILGFNILYEIHNKYDVKISKAYDIIGNLYVSMGKYNKAEIAFNNARSIYLYNNIHSSVFLGIHYFNFGVFYLKISDNHNAVRYFEKSLSILLDYFTDNHPKIVNCYSHLGFGYAQLWDFDTAKVLLQKAISLQESRKDREYKELFIPYSYLGIVHYRLEKPELALVFYEKEYKVLIQNHSKNCHFLAQTYNRIGLAYNAMKDFKKSFIYLSKALEIALLNYGKKSLQAAQSYYYLGENHRRLEEYKEGRKCLQKALISYTKNYSNTNEYNNPPLDKKIFINEALPKILNAKAKNLYYAHIDKKNELYDIQASLFTTQIALLSVDKLRQSYIMEKSKLSLGVKTLEIFEQGIEVGIYAEKVAKKDPLRFKKYMQKIAYVNKSNYPENSLYCWNDLDCFNLAFICSEKSKAIILWDIMKETTAKISTNLPSFLINKEKKLREELVFLEKEIQQKSTLKNAKDLLLVQNERAKKQYEYGILTKKIESEYPNYYFLKNESHTIKVEQLQNILHERLNSNSSTAVISYFWGRYEVHIFVVTSNKKQHYSFERDKTFDDTLTQYYKSLRAERGDEAKNRNEQNKELKQFKRQSYYLFQKLLASVYPLLEGKKLVIIPDGKLHYLPFETLIAEENSGDYNVLPYLVKNHSISYVHSATLLAAYYQNNPHKSATSGLAPIFSHPSEMSKGQDDDEAETIYRKAARGLTTLKKSRKEVTKLKEKFGIKTYLEEKATKKLFLELARKGQNLHIATHAHLNDKHPLYARIYFSEVEQGKGYEALEVWELYGLEMNSNMVFLSACETGIGKIEKGEGIMSISRGFFIAGCKSVFMTLWKLLDSDTTISIVEKFYEGLDKGLPKDEAMQQAKCAYLEQVPLFHEKYAHPHYWATIVGIGNMQQIEIFGL